MNDIIAKLPKMLSGNELSDAMSILPEYDADIRKENQAIRLVALSELYRVYVPSQMSMEIYNKLYLALLRSLQKKGTNMAIQQQNENFKAIRHQEYNGIIGGSDSFTIIGTSGIGKSSAINMAISLITENRIIETEKPYSKIVPCIVIQCPFDSSVKGLLLEILRKIDSILGCNFYENALKTKAAIDTLIGSVSQVALNHIGLLIVDEIQNVVNSKNGKNLVGALTQLINNSGISICMVGTPESTVFFEQAMQLARRSLGLKYDVMAYDDYFKEFCRVVFSYQYVQNKTEITDAIMEWLYEHSAGVISVVVSLIHDAQEVAILNGKEVLSLETLNEAYQQRLSMLHDYIQPQIIHKNQASRTKKKKQIPAASEINVNENGNNISISELVTKAKENQLDVVEVLKNHFSITEVAV